MIDPPAPSVLERHLELSLLADDAGELGLAEVAATVHQLAADLRAPWCATEEHWDVWIEAEEDWLAETRTPALTLGIDWDAAFGELLEESE